MENGILNFGKRLPFNIKNAVIIISKFLTLFTLILFNFTTSIKKMVYGNLILMSHNMHEIAVASMGH